MLVDRVTFQPVAGGEGEFVDDFNAGLASGVWWRPHGCHLSAPGSCIVEARVESSDGYTGSIGWTLDFGPGSCLDLDSDSYDSPADCNDGDPYVYPRALEVVDGMDNQCPGSYGFGAIDETAEDSGFLSDLFGSEYSWYPQAGATQYEAIRVVAPGSSAACDSVIGAETSWDDTEIPSAGELFLYLNRVLAPLVGSWGPDSSGVERSMECP
ncbi:MAG: hypothetical protein GY722_19275 [bacterium]|nr:hypothetical protein [bacterium]